MNKKTLAQAQAIDVLPADGLDIHNIETENYRFFIRYDNGFYAWNKAEKRGIYLAGAFNKIVVGENECFLLDRSQNVVHIKEEGETFETIRFPFDIHDAVASPFGLMVWNSEYKQVAFTASFKEELYLKDLLINDFSHIDDLNQFGFTSADTFFIGNSEKMFYYERFRETFRLKKV